jgi:hypothetical protein
MNLMSKAAARTMLLTAAMLAFVSAGMAQKNVGAAVTVSVGADNIVKISGRFAEPKARQRPTSLSFELSSAGFGDIAANISGLEMFDASGEKLEYRTLVPGEYLAEKEIAEWRYSKDISPRKERYAAAHISWRNADLAVLMTADLLPQMTGPTDITVEIPEGWTAAANGKSGLQFAITDVADGVIVAGAKLKTRHIATEKGGRVSFVSAGEWRFNDADAAAMTKQIFDNYAELFGVVPDVPVQIFVVPFPAKTPFGEWQAETRGNAITVVSSDMAFEMQSVQRLHEQLRHELFHIWLPNMVGFSGSYDWFYEGFALYGSLRLGVAVNRISFRDYLDTLSRAATIAAMQTHPEPLIAASNTRRIGSDTNIYARGLVLAFLCDAAMLGGSKGKRSVDDLLREVFDAGRGGDAKDGSKTVLEIMRKRPELRPIAEKYVAGGETFDLSPALNAVGLENRGEGIRVSLAVVEKPTGRQKEILDRLGYNNWRKLSPKRR